MKEMSFNGLKPLSFDPCHSYMALAATVVAITIRWLLQTGIFLHIDIQFWQHH